MEDVIKMEDIAKGLNELSWDILQMLKKTESLSYTAIKEKLSISQNKVAKELARLEGATLINSKRDQIDARVLDFKLTDNGFKIFNYKK